MSKTLSNILTVFKVARIVAKVVFILCIVGGAGCLLGLAVLPLVGGLLSSQVFVDEGLDLSAAYFGCIVGIIACVGEAVFAFLAERYFKNVLKSETPFTFESSKECFRLGIASIIISVAMSIMIGFASLVVLLLSPASVAEYDTNTSISLSTGLFFMFMSLIFKYGAELHVHAAEEAQQEEQNSEIESQ